MSDKTMEDLFEELKDELTFLPNDEAKEMYLFAFKWLLMQ